MKTSTCFMCALILTVALLAVPAFAQVGGLGVGVGLGGQTKAGGAAGAGVGVGAATGAGAGAQVGTGAQAGANAGVKSSTDAQNGATGADARANSGVIARIQSNPEVAARVQSMLPSGMSLNTASAGFKNEGQFLAALHASQNLNIPFEQLKTRMTGSAATSLGSALQCCNTA